jgi:hypothetical protein
VAEHRVALETHRRGQRLDVRGVLGQGPRLGRRPIRPPGRALVDQQQAADVSERVEVGAEHRVVESGTSVQDEERQRPAPALGHVHARITDVYEHRRTLSSVWR